jgi:hypothetical protein
LRSRISRTWKASDCQGEDVELGISDLLYLMSFPSCLDPFVLRSMMDTMEFPVRKPWLADYSLMPTRIYIHVPERYSEPDLVAWVGPRFLQARHVLLFEPMFADMLLITGLHRHTISIGSHLCLATGQCRAKICLLSSSLVAPMPSSRFIPLQCISTALRGLATATRLGHRPGRSIASRIIRPERSAAGPTSATWHDREGNRRRASHG